MKILVKTNELRRIRRLALGAQGLLHRRPFGQGLPAARRAIAHLGYVQIDTISVVERAHHHVLQARVPGYLPKMLDQLLHKREVFEYWSHAAAFLPMEDFRYSLPYKHAIKSGQHWFKSPDHQLMQKLLDRIRLDGPLRSRDLESPRKKGAGWWDWKPAKKALEQLYMQGDLMVSDREGFQKVYDLTERVLPADVDTSMPDSKAFAEHLLDQQLRCHGVVSVKGLTYLRRNPDLRKAMQTLLQQRLADQRLQQVELPNGALYLIVMGALEAGLPRVQDELRILSPFDNAVIQRDRLKALFGFDYQIECYVPAAKRRYGYFALPLLYRGDFVGRMDCKVHRSEQHLHIKALHLESRKYPHQDLLKALAAALDSFCDFQRCDHISLSTMHPRQAQAAAQRILCS